MHDMDPECTRFLRDISFLRGWPVDKLYINPAVCMVQHFDRGQVLVKEHRKAPEWIYIVKEGSLSLIKKLQGVQPKKPPIIHGATYEGVTGPVMKRPADTSGLFKKQTRFKQRKQYHYRNRYVSTQSQPEVPSLCLPSLPDAKQQRLFNTRHSAPNFKNQIEMEIRLEKSLPGLYNTLDRLGTVNYDKIIKDFKQRVKPSKYRSPVVDDAARDDDVTQEGSQSTEPQVVTSHENRKPILPRITKTKKGTYMTTASLTRTKHLDVPSPGSGTVTSGTALSVPTTDGDTGSSSGTPRREKRKKMKADRTTNLLQPLFILVQVLERGQYFGVSHLLFDEQPRMSVVSNDAVVVMISTSFFRQHTGDDVIRSLRRSEVPFPPESYLAENLKDYTDWSAHRRRVYERLVAHTSQTVKLRKQYTKAYLGQYNYRTGPT